VLGVLQDLGNPLQVGCTVIVLEATIATAFCGIEAAACELHAPLGNDPNDIDCAAYMDEICNDLQSIANDCHTCFTPIESAVPAAVQ
jgi:predicted membrane chloride channel (bestrophin family)